MKTIRNGEVELVTEAFGDPADPPLLMIMGAMASMLWWPDDLCRALAEGGRYVIRYDNRDTGLSSNYDPGEPPYSMEDMADDAACVLDGYGLASAHVVGMSLGGFIAQILALRHPARVRSLTLISTSPMGIDTSGLPQTSEAYMAHAAGAEHVDWNDREQVVDFMVRDSRMIAGSAYPFDEAAARAFIERDVSRARRFASATNHFMLKASEDWGGGLAGLAVPTLVIHGTADPVFPREHGEATATAIAGSRLVLLEGGGHELHAQHRPLIAREVLAHTAGVR